MNFVYSQEWQKYHGCLVEAHLISSIAIGSGQNPKKGVSTGGINNFTEVILSPDSLIKLRISTPAFYIVLATKLCRLLWIVVK